MLFYFGMERLNHLLGRVEVGMSQNVQQPLVAKLALPQVFGLVPTVGVDKQCAPLDARYLLTFVVHLGP